MMARVVLLKTRIPVGGNTISIPGGVALWGVLGSLAVGTLLGQVAGYRQGWWDQGHYAGSGRPDCFSHESFFIW
ncbi:MAG: hypothetical protein R3C44_05800 [Chloroflexota bacterium]